MKSYEEGKRVYWDIRTNKRRQFSTPVPRTEIELYQKGFDDGFVRGLESGINKAKEIIENEITLLFNKTK